MVYDRVGYWVGKVVFYTVMVKTEDARKYVVWRWGYWYGHEKLSVKVSQPVSAAFRN